MSFSTTIDQGLLDTFLTENTTLYLGYSTSTPTKAGTNITEPAGGTGYLRVDISTNLTRTDSEIDNDAEIEFPEATSSQGTITHAVLFDADTAGNMLWFGALTSPKAIDSGDVPRIPIGDFNITQV
jgi:hypothetical protein